MNTRVVPITYLDLHHTAGHEANTQAIRVEHMSPPNNWGDIGYNLVIEADGTVGQGRDVYYAGAHDPGYAPGESQPMNQTAYAVSCIGNFMEDEMTEIQFQSLLREAYKVCVLYKIPLTKVRRHKDQYPTDCPGDKYPYQRLLSELSNLMKGGNDVLKVAVVLFSKEDYWSGTDVSARNGNCAIFIRPTDHSVHVDAMAAQKLIVVGGPTTRHPNEVLLSGNTKYDTAAAVSKYLG